ncbi:MAG: imidazoleglycerol-phosphate dehydratase [Thermoplasmata archaeon]
MTPKPVRLRRTTRETTVEISVRLRGRGRLVWEHPDGMLVHLLGAFARYSGTEIAITGRGDDPHHIAEDCALALGRALRRAVPATGIARFGEATVPMDEVLVQVVLDLVDRPYYRSDLPADSLGEHLLRSLVLEAPFTLHQRTIRPGEPHHLLEATYKALGIAFERATTPASRELSTKGQVDWEELP